MLARLAVLGVMRLPRSSKSRPTSGAPEAARLARGPLRLAVSFSWTAANTDGVTIGARRPGLLAPVFVRAAIDARLPRGINVRRIATPELEWSRQWDSLGIRP